MSHKWNHTVTFRDWLFFLSITPLSSTQVPARISSFSIAEQHSKQQCRCECATVHPVTREGHLAGFQFSATTKKSYQNFPQFLPALSMRVCLQTRSLLIFLLFGTTHQVGGCSWKAQALGWGRWTEKIQVYKQLFGLTVPRILSLSRSKPVCAPESQIFASSFFFF